MLLYVSYIVIYIIGKERTKISFKAITIHPLELSHKDTIAVTEDFSDRVWS